MCDLLAFWRAGAAFPEPGLHMLSFQLYNLTLLMTVPLKNVASQQLLLPLFFFVLWAIGRFMRIILATIPNSRPTELANGFALLTWIGATFLSIITYGLSWSWQFIDLLAAYSAIQNACLITARLPIAYLKCRANCWSFNYNKSYVNAEIPWQQFWRWTSPNNCAVSRLGSKI